MSARVSAQRLSASNLETLLADWVLSVELPSLLNAYRHLILKHNR